MSAGWWGPAAAAAAAAAERAVCAVCTFCTSDAPAPTTRLPNCSLTCSKVEEITDEPKVLHAICSSTVTCARGLWRRRSGGQPLTAVPCHPSAFSLTFGSLALTSAGGVHPQAPRAEGKDGAGQHRSWVIRRRVPQAALHLTAPALI